MSLYIFSSAMTVASNRKDDWHYSEVHNIVNNVTEIYIKGVQYIGRRRGQGIVVIQHNLFISVILCQVRPSKAFIAMRQLQHKARAYSY